ncbi:hypothetical protein JHD50_02435 [Sulfurimonas sp. MAG313]|nr:hypothetical protein [Sulfurimonas sp. MAG313]MDF1880169.1 hypothetical protein [Sulfurimonas sp. MAG313]
MTTHYKDISVKAYAKLIDKSDKTVYKMIKDGLVAAKKKDKGYEIRVDNFMLNRCEDINKSLHTMKTLMNDFSKEVEELKLSVDKIKESNKNSRKKLVLNKKLKPIKKVVKSSRKKILKKSPKKTRLKTSNSKK